MYNIIKYIALLVPIFGGIVFLFMKLIDQKKKLVEEFNGGNMKKVKYKRYMAIIKACNLLKKNDTSVLRFRAIGYEYKISLIKLLKRYKRIPFIITSIQYPDLECKPIKNFKLRW